MPFPIRIDATTLPALIFGGLLVVAAISFGLWASRARRAQESVSPQDEKPRIHARHQFRRRLQVSVMLALVGILIPLGDQLDKLFVARPMLFFVWVLIVFVLTSWMVLMALGDWLSTFAFTAIERSHLRHERTALEEEIRRYHAAKEGHSHSTDDGQEP